MCVLGLGLGLYAIVAGCRSWPGARCLRGDAQSGRVRGGLAGATGRTLCAFGHWEDAATCR